MKKISNFWSSHQGDLKIAVLYLGRNSPLEVFSWSEFCSKHAEILLENIYVKSNLNNDELLELSFAKLYHIAVQKQPLEVFCKKDV